MLETKPNPLAAFIVELIMSPHSCPVDCLCHELRRNPIVQEEMRRRMPKSDSIQ